MKLIFAILATSALLQSALIASQELYQKTCQACHQANGEGLSPAFPPLAESEWVNGPIENLIRIQLRGLSGPITVKGVEYNSAMVPNTAMTDEEIASVLTYVRSNFGNNSSPVTAEQVNTFRSEVGKPMLTVKDLIDPLSEAGKKIANAENGISADSASSTETSNQSSSSATPQKEINVAPLDSDRKLPVYVYFWIGLCILPLFWKSLFNK